MLRSRRLGRASEIIYALVAQLDRASDSDSEGRWFESSQARQKNDLLKQVVFFIA